MTRADCSVAAAQDGTGPMDRGDRLDGSGDPPWPRGASAQQPSLATPSPKGCVIPQRSGCPCHDPLESKPAAARSSRRRVLRRTSDCRIQRQTKMVWNVQMTVVFMPDVVDPHYSTEGLPYCTRQVISGDSFVQWADHSLTDGYALHWCFNPLEIIPFQPLRRSTGAECRLFWSNRTPSACARFEY